MLSGSNCFLFGHELDGAGDDDAREEIPGVLLPVGFTLTAVDPRAHECLVTKTTNNE